jgi:hypothetical protein
MQPHVSSAIVQWLRFVSHSQIPWECGLGMRLSDQYLLYISGVPQAKKKIVAKLAI